MTKLYIYLIERTDKRPYDLNDEYKSAVVVAADAVEARSYHPNPDVGLARPTPDEDYEDYHDTWCRQDEATATLLGEAGVRMTKGVVIAEYIG